MTSTTENLITYLNADGNVTAKASDRIFGPQRVDRTDSDEPYVRLFKNGDELLDDLDSAPLKPLREFFTVECWARDVADLLDETDGLKYVVRNRLHGTTGTVGDQTVQLIQVTDSNDDYLPRGGSGGAAIVWAALDVEVVNSV